ncbi:hypothetical protein GCM10027187_40150 [Streptosporangium sandarakinum]
MSSPPSEQSPDDYRAAEVADLRRRFPTWFILWLPYSRKYGAWHMADPALCRYVDSATTEELSALMCEAELDLCPAWTLPTGHTGQGQARQAPPRGHETPHPPSLKGARGGWSRSRGHGNHARVPAQRVGDAA